MNYCWRCERSYKTQSALDQHKIDSPHHNECPKCNLDYETEQSLKEHMMNAHNMCSVCSQCFDCPFSLDRHYSAHRKMPAGCYACHSIFESKAAMILHLEQEACVSGVKLRHVDYCARACESSEWYLDDGGEYKCPACDKPFEYMSGLVKHAEEYNCDDLMRWKNDPLSIFFRFLKTRIER
ncbi:hypothetical protein HDV63DRAFT_408351 [Trichoderma sp. SZMC 28014]